MKKSTLKKEGFTLIETLVAITVLLLALGGPLTIAARSYFAARFSKDTVTATYLAQEGIELVRHIRSTNQLSGANWMTDLTNCMDGGTCYIGPYASNPKGLSCSGSCPTLLFNPNSFKYQYSNGDPSKFTRTIAITEIESGTEVEVTSKVTWSNGRVNRQVELKENLLNW